MTTLNALRAELDAHAGDVIDGGAAPRTVAVHERVRVIRRRRRAVVAGAAAAVVAVAGGGLALRVPGSPIGPASRNLAGHVAPEHLESLGFRYTFDDADEGSGEASLNLRVSDEPRLISWAGSEDGPVTVSVGEDTRTDDSDFGDFLPIYAGMPGEVTVTGTGRVAVAVYELTDLADGVVANGAVFRRQVAGDTLADATFGEGSESLSLTVPMPEGKLRITDVCTGAPKGVKFEVSVNGEPRIWSDCQDWDVDAGAGGGTIGNGLGDPGDPITVTTRFTRGFDGPLVTPEDAAFGIGLYEVGPSAGTDSPSDVLRVIEADGHLWRLTGIDTSRRGADAFEPTTVLRQPTYVVVHFAHVDKKGLVGGYLGERPAGPRMGGGGTGSTGLGIVNPGDRLSVRSEGDPGPRALFTVAYYERID